MKKAIWWKSLRIGRKKSFTCFRSYSVKDGCLIKRARTSAGDISKVINATLDYQKGKEGGSFFDSRNR